LVEIVNQRVEATIKRLVGQLEPPLCHEQKGGARGRVGGLTRYLQTRSRHGPRMIFSLRHESPSRTSKFCGGFDVLGFARNRDAVLSGPRNFEGNRLRAEMLGGVRYDTACGNTAVST
jgi:hypothetical protein